MCEVLKWRMARGAAGALACRMEALRPGSGFIFTFLVLLSALLGLSVGAQTVPLLRAHAHNDYLHTRPLLDALEQGFCSVEADIYLTNGLLLVAHDLDKAWASNTLEKLYLDPLLARVNQNKGRVYVQPTEFILLIDVKSEAEPTYAVLRTRLLRYAKMLTTFSDKRTDRNAVTVILSGNRPQATVAGEKTRYVSIDGRLADLEGSFSRHLIPLVSDNWTKHFQWRGTGPLPEADQTKLAEVVKTAHSQGRKVRFWAVPDEEQAWRVLHSAGVDLLNTDRLVEMKNFLQR
jgi:glycerophosphoryl diester phosphodiesterase